MKIEIIKAQENKPKAVNANYQTSQDCFVWLADGRTSKNCKYSHKDNLWHSKGLGYVDPKKVLYYAIVPSVEEVTEKMK